MWAQENNRIALLELYATGELRRRQSQDEVWIWLAELPWTRRTGRRNVLSVAPGRSRDLEQLLAGVWPEWHTTWEQLIAARLPVNELGWKKLCDLQRAAELGTLPRRLNRHTAT